jgi:hypothetical protein
MQHIQGISRNQLQMVSLEDKIAPDNALRFIDAFVSVIDLKIFDFCQFNPKKAIGKWLYFKSFFIRFLLFLVFGWGCATVTAVVRSLLFFCYFVNNCNCFFQFFFLNLKFVK